MFTGIIEAVGEVAQLSRNEKDYQITINSGALDMSDVQLGDSIASNGVCLTVVAKSTASFSADVSAETLSKTTFNNFKSGQKLNLEKALMPTSRLGGHMVSGHVDGVGQVVSIENNGRAVNYWIEYPASLAKYIAEKGSITIDGISLTVNDIDNTKFLITIVPHTAQQTTINDFKLNQQVNLEVDVLARYMERLLHARNDEPQQKSTIDTAFLAKHGFVK